MTQATETEPAPDQGGGHPSFVPEAQARLRAAAAMAREHDYHGLATAIGQVCGAVPALRPEAADAIAAALLGRP